MRPASLIIYAIQEALLVIEIVLLEVSIFSETHQTMQIVDILSDCGNHPRLFFDFLHF